MAIVARHDGAVNWKKVAVDMGGKRTNDMCRHMYTRIQTTEPADVAPANAVEPEAEEATADAEVEVEVEEVVTEEEEEVLSVVEQRPELMSLEYALSPDRFERRFVRNSSLDLNEENFESPKEAVAGQLSHDELAKQCDDYMAWWVRFVRRRS